MRSFLFQVYGYAKHAFECYILKQLQPIVDKGIKQAHTLCHSIVESIKGVESIAWVCDLCGQIYALCGRTYISWARALAPQLTLVRNVASAIAHPWHVFWNYLVPGGPKFLFQTAKLGFIYLSFCFVFCFIFAMVALGAAPLISECHPMYIAMLGFYHIILDLPSTLQIVVDVAFRFESTQTYEHLLLRLLFEYCVIRWNYFLSSCALIGCTIVALWVELGLIKAGLKSSNVVDQILACVVLAIIMSVAIYILVYYVFPFLLDLYNDTNIYCVIFNRLWGMACRIFRSHQVPKGWQKPSSGTSPEGPTASSGTSSEEPTASSGTHWTDKAPPGTSSQSQGDGAGVRPMACSPQEKGQRTWSEFIRREPKPTPPAQAQEFDITKQYTPKEASMHKTVEQKRVQQYMATNERESVAKHAKAQATGQKLEAAKQEGALEVHQLYRERQEQAELHKHAVEVNTVYGVPYPTTMAQASVDAYSKTANAVGSHTVPFLTNLSAVAIKSGTLAAGLAGVGYKVDGEQPTTPTRSDGNDPHSHV